PTSSQAMIMSPSFDLTSRRALVTGATRGIGLAVAQALARHGAAVAITGRKPDTVAATVEQLRAVGADARGYACHQGDPAAIEQLFAQLDAANFVPDVAVINAATNPVMGPLLNVELEAWRKILDVNLTGAFITARMASLRMLPQRRGALVFM